MLNNTCHKLRLIRLFYNVNSLFSNRYALSIRKMISLGTNYKM